MSTAHWTTPSLQLRSVVTGTSQLPAPFEPNPTLLRPPSLHNALLKVRRVFCPILYIQSSEFWEVTPCSLEYWPTYRLLYRQVPEECTLGTHQLYHFESHTHTSCSYFMHASVGLHSAPVSYVHLNELINLLADE